MKIDEFEKINVLINIFFVENDSTDFVCIDSTKDKEVLVHPDVASATIEDIFTFPIVSFVKTVVTVAGEC